MTVRSERFVDGWQRVRNEVECIGGIDGTIAGGSEEVGAVFHRQQLLMGTCIKVHQSFIIALNCPWNDGRREFKLKFFVVFFLLFCKWMLSIDVVASRPNHLSLGGHVINGNLSSDANLWLFIFSRQPVQMSWATSCRSEAEESKSGLQMIDGLEGEI